MFCGKEWQLIGPPKIYLGSTQFLELNLNSCLKYNKAVYNMNNVQRLFPTYGVGGGVASYFSAGSFVFEPPFLLG